MRTMILQRVQRLHSDESGQVLWIFVISGLALVVLAALVFNSGRQATRKIEMQNAVDASAISGATWVARGMNVISMDNVGMTETLGIIANLRAIEQVIPINREILQIEDQIAHALMSNPFTFAAGVVIEIGVVAGGLDQDFVMEPLCDIACGWAKPTTGPLWQFMRALSGFSNVMAKGSYFIGAGEAYNLSKENIRGFSYQGSDLELSDGAAFLPTIKDGWTLPAEPGSFQELCDPTKHGTNSDSPIAIHGYTPFLGYQRGKGPFEKYKSWAIKLWSPSFITGIPWWYGGVADLNLEVFCHGSGSTPQLPKIPVRTSDLGQARAQGAHDFVWLHSWVYTNKIVQDPAQPPPTVNFEPNTPPGGDYNSIAQQMKDSGMSADELKSEALRQAQKQTTDKPVYSDKNVDPESYGSELLTEDAGFQPPGRQIRNWIWTTVSTNSQVIEEPDPSGGKPIPKIQYVLKEDRYTFEYATISKSFDDKLKGAKETGDPNGYPQPFHFVVDGGPLLDPNQLPQAVESLQYLTIAHKQKMDEPWLNGLKVSIRGTRRPVFENSSPWGLLTYAQAQVYNPTSWDLYTQDWHAKLVRTTTLDQLLNGGSQTGGGLLQGVSSALQELNAH